MEEKEEWFATIGALALMLLLTPLLGGYMKLIYRLFTFGWNLL